MQYSPKLKKAMSEIKTILKKYDIGAMIILHEPGSSEWLNHIDPSWSCIKMEGPGLRIRAKTIDFNGDIKKRDKVLNDSVNMITHFAEVSGKVSLQYFGVLDQLKKILDIEFLDGEESSHTDQNN